MQKSKELRELGKKVRKKRLSLGLSQTQLGYKLDKDRTSISRLENGHINPSYLYILEVSKGLGVSISELLN